MVQSRLEGWQIQLLSRVRRATLIRLVIQAIPIYISTFRVPKGICEDLNNMARHFWWGVKAGKWHFFAIKVWTELCTPKEQRHLV